MKWETVQREVAGNLHTRICRGAYWPDILRDLSVTDFAAIRENRDTGKPVPNIYADKAWDAVMAWDIRCVGKLRDLFPQDFPPSLRKGGLECFIDSAGNWVVEKRKEREGA